ncbi:GAF domain-containing protein [Luteimonas sp. 100069]|uniref:GAF domain-containing protein n=1 Tax=Luteimonas sp. 100069 TaxID=2006109 RepID=UPI000F50E466|nr:GAF domain-containing protein [Luteimonas sp. 100069]RPD87658.1 GAF domain-containing protein [Luteimonas sp. 100069]
MHANQIYLEQLRFLLMAGHIRGALEFLNIQSGYRFTAIYRLGPTHAENFMLIDRENEPDTMFAADIPRDDTYCHIVHSLATTLVIEDAAVDPRLAANPYRNHVRAYCSVPLQADSTIFGTLCHFDTDPRESSEETLLLMQEMGLLLSVEDVSKSRRRAEMELRVDRLSDMKQAITDASLDVQSARSAFDEYAVPLLEEARQRLPVTAAREIEARITAIWRALVEEQATRVESAAT